MYTVADNRAVHTRENKPQHTLVAAYINGEHAIYMSAAYIRCEMLV